MRFPIADVESPFPAALARAAAVLAIVTGLTACGGGGATAQPAPRDDGRAHLYAYEVSPEHAQALQAQESPFVEVSGTATVSVTPDRVRASFAVETRAAAAADAAADNAQLMDRVVRALRASGIQGIEIETFGYALRPEYSWTEGQPVRTRVIDGYTAVNNIRASATDVQAAGKVLDTAIQAGANRVSSLAFEASDTEAARAEALAQAVRNARAQAQVMAEALGRVLGPPLEVRGGAEVPYPRRPAEIMLRAAESAMDTPIEAGDLTVSASVTVRFALGGTVEDR